MSDEKTLPQGEEQEEILTEEELDEAAGGATTEPRNPFGKGLAADNGAGEDLWKTETPRYLLRR